MLSQINFNYDSYTFMIKLQKIMGCSKTKILKLVFLLVLVCIYVVIHANMYKFIYIYKNTRFHVIHTHVCVFVYLFTFQVLSKIGVSLYQKLRELMQPISTQPDQLPGGIMNVFKGNRTAGYHQIRRARPVLEFVYTRGQSTTVHSQIWPKS